MIALIIVSALIILFGLFLLTPLQFGIELIKSTNTYKTFICFKILGIPLKFPLKQKKISVNQNKTIHTDEKLTLHKFMENFDSFKEIYLFSKQELFEMLSYVRQHLSICNVDFNIHFGFDNAALTGISTGAIWSTGSFVLKVIDSLIGIKKINMQVNPDFNCKIFEIYSKTILIMRPIHFIIILNRVIKVCSYVKNKINNIKGGV